MNAAGINVRLNTVLKSAGTALPALSSQAAAPGGAPLDQEEINKIYTGVQAILPNMTASTFSSSVTVPITAQVQSQLAQNGIAPVQQSYVSDLSYSETTMSPGGVMVGAGFPYARTAPHLQEATCALYYIGIVGLIASAALTGGIEAFVFYGASVSYGSLFGASAGILGVLHGVVNC